MLQPLQAQMPMGQFDMLDAQATTSLGGEVCQFSYVSVTGSDVSAPDVEDGYIAQLGTRAAITTTLVSGRRPLFLLDEGTANYGTLFGTVVGASCGQSTSGTVIGPHTAAASGKGTLWYQPGLYSVTLDAVDTTINTGLLPTNAAASGNCALYATTAGLLTPNLVVAFEALVLARLVEFAPSGSLVTTPLSQVQALNSPPGAVSPGARFTTAVIMWDPEI